MSVLLQLNDVTKSYGSQTLLDQASFSLHQGEKIGFIGRNGAGKSTACRILLGEEEIDSGEVINSPRLRIGYLKQHDPFQPGESALEYLMRDTGQPDWKCGDIAGEFELKGRFLEGPVKELSGGWQTRVKLAALLLHDPNLLVLDEPTNFLDVRTQMLLEHFLQHFRESCLIVSHDRDFLERTCNTTLELSRGRLTKFTGGVNQYLENLEIQKQQAERTNEAVETKRKQLQKFIDKNRANANTASQARSKAKQLERLQSVDIEVDEAKVTIIVPQVEPRKGPAVRCVDVAIGYPDVEVANNITLEIEHGSRAGIVGDNGQGKTTFLRTLVGSLEPHSGSVRWGHNCDLGVYAQHVYTTLPQDWTIQQYLDSCAAPGTTTQQVLAVAGSFLFRGPLLQKKVKVLSGGERARLCLAGLLLSKHNILVLDEPGNHLDVETIEALADALQTFEGTVIFTSHDRHFMSRIATQVIEVKDGHVADYPADYETYLYRIEKEIEAGERERQGKTAASSAFDKKQAKGKNKGKGKGPRDPRKQLKNIEKELAKLDGERTQLNDQFLQQTDPEKAQELHEQLETIRVRIEELEVEWCELSEELGDW